MENCFSDVNVDDDTHTHSVPGRIVDIYVHHSIGSHHWGISTEANAV